MEMRLLVLRSPDPKKLAEFYSLLGLSFEYHKHGQSPYHYGGHIGSMVFEIYPLSKMQSEVDQNLRLGFGIDAFDETMLKLKSIDTPVLMEPAETEFGYMAIVSDPDNRKIELYKN